MKMVALLTLMAAIASGCSSSSPSDVEIKDLYIRNSGLFNRLVEICVIQSDIKSIGWKSGKLDVIVGNAKTALLSREEEIIITKMHGLIVPQQIDCLRTFERGVGKLVAVRFIFFGTRFGIRREYKALNRNLNASAIWLEEKTKTGELRSIGVKDWYIFEPKE